MEDNAVKSEDGNAGPGGKTPRQPPVVNTITFADVADSVAAAARDFRAAPLYGLFFGGIYTIGGWLIAYFLIAFDLPFLAYPTATGFALIAPFVAAGTYEVSRRLEIGEPLTWPGVLGSVWERGGKDLGWMALVTVFAFYIWIDLAGIIYLVFFGLNWPDWSTFLPTVFGTPHGLAFLIVGNLAGAMIAVIVFSITAVSFPLLLDRDIDFVTAMITSVKAVTRNPKPMIAWCFIIAVVLIGSLATLLSGMLILLPLIGHATWHLYRRVVAPEAVTPVP